MIKANFNAYNSYITDSLYQWDLNQVLTVTGLNLAVVPEVHFSNANMERAIVRQSAMVNQVVSVGIPNSLLQDPLTIEADIGIYEGDTFKVVEKVLIPVKPKKRPADYRIQDSDEEIYSFNALKNSIANMVKLSDFNTNNKAISARIDNIIAHNNDTEGNTELLDIRTAFDGSIYDSAGTAVRRQFEKLDFNFMNCKTLVKSDNYLTVLPDANEIRNSSIYIFNFNYNSTEITANLPFDKFTGRMDTLLTFGNAKWVEDNYVRQLYISNEQKTGRVKLYTRASAVPGSWDDWKVVSNYDDIIDSLKVQIDGEIIKDKGVVMSSDYATILPDANEIYEPSVYRLNFNFNATDITANLPYTQFRGRVDTLITLGNSTKDQNYRRQFLIGYDGVTFKPYAYTRVIVNANAIDNWVSLIPEFILPDTVVPRYIVAKDGSGDFTSVTECFETHKDIKCDIYIRTGDYDLLEEFTAIYGDDFITGINRYEGLNIDHGKRVFLDAGTKLIFDYDGDIYNIYNFFSPIKFSGEGGELHGGYIYCRNGRYCIHDDVYTSPYSRSLISGVYCEKGEDVRPVCIGGGLGQHSDITVENCILKTPTDSNGIGAFYHNSTLKALGSIKITGNYAENCRIYVQGYGPSTEKTPAIVTNNKATRVYYTWEIEGDPNGVDNMEFIGFNNIETET